MEREGSKGSREGSKAGGREGRATKRVCCRAAANALPCAQQLLWGSLKNLANFLAFFSVALRARAALIVCNCPAFSLSVQLSGMRAGN